MNKFCIVCGKPLPRYKSKLCSDKCRREWRKEYDRVWRQNNAEKIKEWHQSNRERKKEYDRERYRNNQEKFKEYQRKYRLNNPEKKKESAHKYRLNNQEKIKKHKHEYYQNNTEREKKRSREWCRNNPERKKEYDRGYYRDNQEILKDKKRKQYLRSRGLPEDWDLSKESSIETIMKRWLQESDIEFIQQHSINFENTTWIRVDFYIPEANVCLYCDGGYWHSLPEVQERDGKQNKILASMGYSVVRMTETEILEGNRPWWIGELISAKW